MNEMETKMSYRYKAFISYRHKPLDMKVAVKLHRAIEHFKVPKDLQKDGSSKIGIVFRDQDELPISGSLSDNITEALDDSEYLIVICSPDTPKSEWVKREITYFSKTHGHDHVLSVLIDGAPEESFPEVLTKIYDENSGQDIDIEPLAANIVADSDSKRWKLFEKEKLRIFASLLGCKFDELYRREQRYKRRRNLTLGSVTAVIALTFIGVLLNRNAVIKKNYEQALRNQSMYLASESNTLFDEGDRLGSIAVAMEALPLKDSERPLVSKAQYALARSVGAYSTPWNVGFKGSYVASCALKHGERVKEFILSPERDILISLTEDGQVTSWDTDMKQVLWTKPFEDTLNTDISGITDSGILIMYSSDDLLFIDAKSGEEISVFTLGREGDYINIYRVIASEDGKAVIALSNKEVVSIDIAVREIKERYELPELRTYSLLAVSADGKKAAVGYSDTTYLLTGVFVVDMESKDRIFDLDLGEDAELYFDDAVFTGESTLALSYSWYLNNMSGMAEGIMVQSFGENTHYLDLYDLESGNRIWQSKRDFSDSGYSGGMIFTELAGIPVIAAHYSACIEIVDAKQGEVLAFSEFPSVIASIEAENGRIYCITKDGGFGNVEPGSTDWTVVYPFMSGIREAVFRLTNYWILQEESDSVIHYGIQDPDPTLSVMELDIPEEVSSFYSYNYYMNDSGMVIGGPNWKEILYCGSDFSKLTYLKFPGSDSQYYYALISAEGSIFTFVSGKEEGKNLLRFNVETGQYYEEEFPDEEYKELVPSSGCISLDDEVLTKLSPENGQIVSAAYTEGEKYILTLEGDYQIRRYDAKTGELLSRCSFEYSGRYSESDIRWTDSDRGIEIMFICNNAYVISKEDWDVSAYIPGCSGYVESKDSFAMIPNNILFYKTGLFKRHTAESLAGLGNEILGEWTLSEEQKMRYGIQ